MSKSRLVVPLNELQMELVLLQREIGFRVNAAMGMMEHVIALQGKVSEIIELVDKIGAVNKRNAKVGKTPLLKDGPF